MRATSRSCPIAASAACARATSRWRSTRIPARADEAVLPLAHIRGLLADHADLAARIRDAMGEAKDNLTALQRLMNDRFGIERSVDVKPLRSLLDTVVSVLPAQEAATADDTGDEGATADIVAGDMAAVRGPRRGGVLGIDSREEAIRAIELVCAYLERSEPTNPAQLLLRRAARVIDKNFLQLVRSWRRMPSRTWPASWGSTPQHRRQN